jgi:hypothetical protein
MFLFSCQENESKRAILFISEQIVEMNDIKFDSSYKINYLIKNNGNTDLVIDTITTSCGCSIPKLQKQRISAMDSAILSVEYKPVDTGRFDKKIVIKSNIDSSFTVVSFKGRAIK